MSRRVTNLAGHTLKPYYQYITEVNLRTSPIDKLGNRKLLHFHKIFSGWNSKLVQPDLKIKLKEDPDVANAYFIVHYKNGWKNVYSLSDLTPEEIQESLKDYGIFLYDHMNALMEDEDYDMQLYKY